MQPRMWENEYRATMVCIDSNDEGALKGRFYNQYCPGGEQFQGVMEFLRKMEDMLNQMQFPQSFSVVRTFGESSAVEREAPAEMVSWEGKLATFAVKVLFRQNASWQGSVTWLEGRREESFRSVLELLLLLDSALRAVERPI